MQGALAALLLLASAAPAGADGRRGDVPEPAALRNAETVENATPAVEEPGTHWRIEAAEGVVHAWVPDGFDPEHAGIVVYVHGYFTDVDHAWSEHRLAQQFAASGRNALFVVPSAPGKFADPVPWPALDRLLAAVEAGTGLERPRGPLVVVGHSGAFRTVVSWLADPRLATLVLLDAMYRFEPEFKSWLGRGTKAAPHRMILVALETLERAERFARQVRGTARRNAIPERADALTPAERKARLLYFRSQYDHMELVTGGRVIPLFLQWTPLPSVRSTR